jgi:hypothetical protein
MLQTESAEGAKKSLRSMHALPLDSERVLSENVLREGHYDFSAKFIAVGRLRALSDKNPECLAPDTLTALEGLFLDPSVGRQTQSYFLYREAALTICSIITNSKHLAGHALSSLKALLAATSASPHRAVAEAMGALPFSIDGPEPGENSRTPAPGVTLEQILDKHGLIQCGPLRGMGRSLVTKVRPGNRLLVIKMARQGESLDTLAREPLWMKYLGEMSGAFSKRFDIPSPVEMNGSYIFRIQDMPQGLLHEGMSLRPEGCAVGFVAHRDYFIYAGDSAVGTPGAHEQFNEVICRNAWLLGRLSCSGIIHSAPVPLFHNRIQRRRRNDRGLYEWPRGGRLDRWLESCSYPNMGLTGLRDFEHLVSFRGRSRQLYRHIGTHLLSLMLLTGAYFRNMDRERVGVDDQGRPVDARDLFDRDLLKMLTRDIFLSYYHGFVGLSFPGSIPFDLDLLSFRMIQEMGVDRHMEEVLRVQDQREMTDEGFKGFLLGRGLSMKEIGAFKRGSRDIVIQSGPHLGPFNHHISLPELIDFVSSMSALCIAGRYFR